MQSENPMSFFSENVDDWGAAEWFDRAAKAIRSQDKANVKGDDIAFETYRMIAASSLAQLVREHEDTVRAALSTDAEPVRTPFEVASKHIPEARVSLLSRAIRQGLNDYGWKNFGTLPEVLMSYIVEAERAEETAHQQGPRDCGQDGGGLSERRDNIGSAYTRPLYAEPVKTAPAVAVKAGWALVPILLTKEMCAAVDGVHETGSFNDRWEAAISASPALSAQVQDVAGWRDFSNAPKDGTKFDVWYPARLGLEGYRRVDVYWSDIQDTFCTDGSFGPDEPCPIMMRPGPSHWTPLPASPASKHGDAE